MTLLGHCPSVAFLVGLWALSRDSWGARRDAPICSRARATRRLRVRRARRGGRVARGRHLRTISPGIRRGVHEPELADVLSLSALYADKGQPAVLATVLSLFAVLAQLLTSRRHRVYLPMSPAHLSRGDFFISVMLSPRIRSSRLAFARLDVAG